MTRQHAYRFLAICLVATLLAVFSSGAHAGPYRDAVLADNPAGYWRLESAGATISNEVAGSPGGTLVIEGTGEVSSMSGPIFSEPSNNAIWFNETVGSDNSNGALYEVLDAAAQLGSNGAYFAVEFWINTADGGQGNQNPVAKGGATAGATFFNKAGDFSFGVNTCCLGAQGVGVANDVWKHLVGTMERDTPNAGETTMTVYVDGVQVDSGIPMDGGNPVQQNDNSTNPFTIGGLRLGTNYYNPWQGKLDEVAVYTQPVDPARWTAHFNAAVPEPSAGVLMLIGALALLRRRRG